jgi:nucleotide-binding universal stress UspA family protein
MPVIQKALVAINDSEAALHAFVQALQLSRRLGFELGAVSVAPPYGGDLSLVGVRSLKSALCEPIRTVLEEALKMAVDEGAGLETFWAEGMTAECILGLTLSGDYDLVIIGQARRTCWMAWDSLTARLIRECPTDLLVIPQQQPLHLKRILCLDHGCAAGGAALRRAGTLAGVDGGALGILRLVESGSSAAAISPVPGCAELAPAMVRVEVFEQKKALLRRTSESARRHEADLLVLQNAPGMQPWDRLTGGWILRMLRRAFLPTWIVRGA